MSRIYDASQLTKRRQERAIAGSFLSPRAPNLPNVMNGSRPLLGISESSIMNSVKTGSMTEITRYDACYGISPGCPCPALNSSVYSGTLALPFVIPPGSVVNITTTIGSIIVSWDPPLTGTGPFTYRITPYKNGAMEPYVETTNTSYRFVDIEEGEPYTFDVVAMNTAGAGPIEQPKSYIIAPPKVLSDIMSNAPLSDTNVTKALKYVLNDGINNLLDYCAKANKGPTLSSHILYLWSSSVAQAWNWVSHDGKVTGIHDEWNWDENTSTDVLANNEKIVWMCLVIQHITPVIISSPSNNFYKCPESLELTVKGNGEWDMWVEEWNNWYTSRVTDPGFIDAKIIQPTETDNWNKTIIVEEPTAQTDITNSIWTPLTVGGRKQTYLTYNWGNVRSSCMSSEEESALFSEIDNSNNGENVPKTDTDGGRAQEIAELISITSELDDSQKILAELWAGGPGTVSPPLMFLWLWKQYMMSTNTVVRSLMSPTYDITDTDIIYSLLDVSIHMFEGGRITWAYKKNYMEARPIQEVRRLYAELEQESWNGNIKYDSWIPYQMSNFVTPPFADFPSGHSHFSKAFALTMSKWFGDSIVKNPVFNDRITLISPLFKENTKGFFGEFEIKAGNSEIQPGIVPATDTTWLYDNWTNLANAVGWSRIYGGIHARTAHYASVNIAEIVDRAINIKWGLGPDGYMMPSTMPPPQIEEEVLKVHQEPDIEIKNEIIEPVVEHIIE
jgi:hypothetical protein